MSKLKFHPLCLRMPDMEPGDLIGLEDDIRENGQREEIILLDGKILDGRHRYKVCLSLGIEPKMRVYNAKLDGPSPESLVLSKALHRNLTKLDKPIVAERFVDDFERSATDKGKAATIAARRFGLGREVVDRVRTIRLNTPDLYERLCRREFISVNAAYKAYVDAKRVKEVTKQRREPKAELVGIDIREGDCLGVMTQIKSDSIDCVFTDPPYNIGVDYGNGRKADKRPDDEYLAWCQAWMHQCARVLKPGGAMFVMINGLYAGRYDTLLRQAENGALRWRNTIYWWENNPEYQTGNFSDAVRPVFYFVKTGSPHVWNGTEWREPSLRNKIADKRGDPAGRVPDNVWKPDQLFADPRVPGNADDRVKFADAPPQIPFAIPYRLIFCSTNPGDTVLDPFNGNGTTGLAAALQGRGYIGIEANKTYAKQSREWVAGMLAKYQEHK